MEISHAAAAAADLDPDRALVAQAQRGDRAALEAIYLKYVKRIYNLVIRLGADRQNAPDLTQEAFLQIYRSLPRFEGRSRFYTWAFRIATNVALAGARRRAPATPFADDHAQAGMHADPVLTAERRAMYERIEAALAQLSPIHRTMMVLGPIQGHSYHEIAAILGISVDAVKGRMHRARVSLIAALEESSSLLPSFRAIRAREGVAA